MKNIIVPTDFSACASKATEAAMMIAKVIGARVHLFTHINMPPNVVHRKEEHGQLIKNARLLMQDIEERYPDTSIEQHIQGGDFLKSLNELAAQLETDLIVMGSHGTKGITRFLTGSNTYKVIQHIKKPVLVVKHSFTMDTFNKVVYVSSFEREELPAFLKFKDLVKHFIPTIYLVYVLVDPVLGKSYSQIKESMQPFEAACAPLNCESRIYLELNVKDGAAGYSDEVEAGLIGISNHVNRQLRRLFFGSNVKRLVNGVDLPVLTVDYEEEAES